MLGLDRALGRPVLLCEDAHLLRRQPLGRRLGLVLTQLGHPREPFFAQDLPHRRARQRRPRPRKLGDDLLDPVPGATQLERPLPGGILLGLTLGPRPRGLEQLSHIRLAVLRDQRLHARLRITKPLGDLRRRQLLDVVGAQRLIPTVPGDRRLGEAFVSRPGHRSAELVNETPRMVHDPSDGSTSRPYPGHQTHAKCARSSG